MFFQHSEPKDELPRTEMTATCNPLLGSKAKSHVAVTFLQPNRTLIGYGCMKQARCKLNKSVTKPMTPKYENFITLLLMQSKLDSGWSAYKPRN